MDLGGRKRAVTNEEAMVILQKHSKNFRAAAQEIVEVLLPENFVPSEESSEEAKRMENVLSSLHGQLQRFLNKYKKRKRRVENKDGKFFSGSQDSIFSSQKYPAADDT